MGKDEEEGVPESTQRQLDILSIPDHPNISKGLEVVVDGKNRYLLMEYAEYDLMTLLHDHCVYFSVQEV